MNSKEDVVINIIETAFLLDTIDVKWQLGIVHLLDAVDSLAETIPASSQMDLESKADSIREIVTTILQRILGNNDAQFVEKIRGFVSDYREVAEGEGDKENISNIVK